MLEQITTTQVGALGMLGFLACVLVGIGLYAWFMKEIKESGTQDT